MFVAKYSVLALVEFFAIGLLFPNFEAGSDILRRVATLTFAVSLAGQILGDVLNSVEYCNGPILTFVKRAIFVVVGVLVIGNGFYFEENLKFIEGYEVTGLMAEEWSALLAGVMAPSLAILLIVILYASGIGAAEKRWLPFVYPASVVGGILISIPIAKLIMSTKNEQFFTTLVLVILLPLIIALIVGFMSKRWPFEEE